MTISGETARLRDILVPRLAGPHRRVELDDGEVAIRTGARELDDCAVLTSAGDLDVVVGSDYVRGTKFSLFETGHLTYFDIGVYLVAANVSDIAAMCARPLALLSVIRFPPDMTDDEFGSLVDGIAWACRENDVSNIGGDIGSAERLILSGTAIGVCDRGAAVHRSGARPGDLVYLSGPVGTAAAAVAYFLTGERSLRADDEEVLLEPWRRARPRSDVAEVLRRARGTTACIDTSDGLGTSLRLLAGSSSVGLEIAVEHIPTVPVLHRVARRRGLDPVALALSTSVDFELLFTVDGTRARHVEVELERAELEVTRIGRVTGEPGVRFLGDGARQRLELLDGWDHGSSGTFVDSLLEATSLATRTDGV